MAAPLPLAVAVVLRREDGAILVVRRAEQLALGGYWTPVTGRVEPGESLTAAALRELREETGLVAELGPELTRGPTSNGLFELVYFRATIRDPLPPLVLQTREVSDARWLQAAQLATLEPMLATTRQILARAFGEGST